MGYKRYVKGCGGGEGSVGGGRRGGALEKLPEHGGLLLWGSHQDSNSRGEWRIRRGGPG